MPTSNRDPKLSPEQQLRPASDSSPQGASMLNSEQLLAVVWKRRLTVVVTFLLTLAAVAAVTFSLPKTYSTTSYLLVNSKAGGSAFEATQVNDVITKTYAELLQTRNTADLVARALPFPVKGAALQTAVTVQPVAQSQLLDITAQASSPDKARTIANTYASQFIATVAKRASGNNSTTVSLAEPAARITTPTSPKPKLYLLIGGLLALAAGVSCALVRQRLDQRLVIDDTTTEIFGLPVIGRIPERSSSRIRSRRRTQEGEPELSSVPDEAFRLVLANLGFVNHGERPASIAIVSAGPAEGKTSCAIAVSQAATELGAQVAVIDADLRKPGLTERLSPGTRRPGLSNFLARSTPAPLSDFVTEFPGSRLRLVPSGPVPPNPAALLSSKALDDFHRRAQRTFDFIVYDTPPLSVAADASLLAARVGGVVLVLDAGKTRRSAVLNAVDQLERAEVNILGIVVNRVSESPGTYYGYGDSDGGAPQDEPEQGILVERNGRGELGDSLPAIERV